MVGRRLQKPSTALKIDRAVEVALERWNINDLSELVQPAHVPPPPISSHLSKCLSRLSIVEPDVATLGPLLDAEIERRLREDKQPGPKLAYLTRKDIEKVEYRLRKEQARLKGRESEGPTTREGSTREGSTREGSPVSHSDDESEMSMRPGTPIRFDSEQPSFGRETSIGDNLSRESPGDEAQLRQSRADLPERNRVSSRPLSIESRKRRRTSVMTDFERGAADDLSVENELVRLKRRIYSQAEENSIQVSHAKADVASAKLQVRVLNDKLDEVNQQLVALDPNGEQAKSSKTRIQDLEELVNGLDEMIAKLYPTDVALECHLERAQLCAREELVELEREMDALNTKYDAAKKDHIGLSKRLDEASQLLLDYEAALANLQSAKYRLDKQARQLELALASGEGEDDG